MRSYYFIVNPASGRGAGKAAITQINAQMDSLGETYAIVETGRPWHAAELAEQAANGHWEVIVAVGGDGTANEVLNGILNARQTNDQAQPAMGIISVGRGNDMAFGMGIPAGVDAGIRTLTTGKPHKVDVGLVLGGDYPQGRYFGNGIGIGFDAVVGFEAAKITWLQGFPNYIVAALKTIFLFDQAPLVSIECNKQQYEIPALMVSIMNGRRMGGGFMMAPDALTQDGLFNLCIAGHASRSRILSLIPYFMKGTQNSQPEIKICQSSWVRVKATRGSLPAHADGETLCEHGESLEIKILPGILDMIVPG